MRRVIAAGFLVAALLPRTAGAAPVAPLSGPAALAIDWTMPDRFGGDRDRDGLVDFPNTADYAQNAVAPCAPCPTPRFRVVVEALGPATSVIGSYEWTLRGGLGAPVRLRSGDSTLAVDLPEGEYAVEVVGTVLLPFGRLRVRGTGAVMVDDLLVVALGDSYASGEGNPEVGRGAAGDSPRWGDGGDAAATVAHARAHRSTVAWPARTALALEAGDPRTSVTFVSVATSAARIDWGILTPQGAQGLSQLDQIAALVGGRTIDLLLVQEGGNSIGFSRLVRALVEADPLFDPVCYDLMVDQAIASARDGNWTRGTRLVFRLPFDWSCATEPRSSGIRLPGLDGLESAFDRLADGLERFAIERVVLVGYPDPTGADTAGADCGEIVGDVTPPLRFHEISRTEARRGVTEVLVPLNAALEAAARDQGWWYVGGVASSFAAGHGYCAPWPDYGYPAGLDTAPGFAIDPLDYPDGWYRNPGPNPWPPAPGSAAVTWYRNAAQSAVLQGPQAPYATTGTLHPNEVGHAAIALLVMQRLAAGGFGQGDSLTP